MSAYSPDPFRASARRGQGPGVIDAVRRGFDYFQHCQRDNGCIAEAPGDQLYLRMWDSVNALRATALWRDTVPPPPGLIDGALGFLRSVEKANGMISWGDTDIGPHRYCAETSSEYVAVLTELGNRERAREKAVFLRGQQLPTGPWEVVHPDIPDALQTVPSVTAFVLGAMTALEVEAVHLDAALDFLLRSQTPEGHFGMNAYYCATHYYLLRPIVATLVTFGCYAAAARARDFVLSGQLEDGSWFSTTEGYEGFSSPEFHTALALETLANAGLTMSDPAVSRAVGWLLEKQRPDGSWHGGLYAVPSTTEYREIERTQDVYTTASVLCALRLLTITGGTHDGVAN